VQWTIRQAEHKDSEAIIALVDSAYRGESSRAGWTTEADLLDGRRTFTEEVEAIIAAPQNKIILLESDDALLASIHIKKSGSNENKGRAYLGMFAVSPNFQNQGIGKTVLSYVEKFVVEEWQCSEMEMTVIRQRLELIGWYEKLGYRVTGETRAFPYGDERYGVPKRKDLVLDVLVKCL
jgi:ribosomal protein S18 acetylase RimI-like enzyme